VDAGQVEAARALGMTRTRVLRYVEFPQALRVIVPPLGNEFNGTMKDTALLTIIGGVELFHAFSEINGQQFKPFELYLAMSLYYLLLTLLWTGAQALIERRLNRGVSRTVVRRVRRSRDVGVLATRSAS
jgi:polar amino acid transport system permease protein